jgi:membrane-bound serine protease (ClpP class)
MRKKFTALLLVLLFFYVPAISAQPEPADRPVYVIPITGAVERGLQSYLERSFAEAVANDASAIILEINTPGGRVDSASEIRRLISDAPMPVYAYVRYNAISAGAFLALACDALYMAPGSTIGAAELVILTGEEVDEKSMSVWEAEMRSVAERQGKDPDIASAMVRREIAIEGLVAEGRLLTLTTTQAEELAFTDGVFATRGELLDHLGLADAAETTVPQSPAEDLARIITHPAVATLLITIGLAALVIEVMTAGFGVAGMISMLAFALFFGGHVVAGFAGREVIFMFVVGIVLLLAEAILPNFGIIGLSGLAAIVASVVLSAGTTGQGVRMLVAAMFLASLVIMASLRFLKRTGLWSQIVLQYAETKELGYVGPGDSSHLVGRDGITITSLRPSGTAEIDGKRVDVVSEGGFIAQSTPVKVVGTEGTRVVVRPQ